MRSDARTILFVREVPWESYFPISTRRLAGEFARDGWNVIWLTPPLMPWHRAGRKSHFQQFQAQHATGGIFYEDNVFAYTPKAYIPFSVRFPLDHPLLAHWMWHACWPPVRQVLQRANIPDPDLLFISSWTAGEVTNLFPQRPIVFHVTDNYRHYPAVPASAVRLERQNYVMANHIIVTSPSLNEMLQTEFQVSPDRLTTIVHGVDLDGYSPSPATPPDGLATLPHPRLVALGNTEKLDYPVLTALADAFPEGSIVILGPSSPGVEKLAAAHRNIVILGRIDPADVPVYLDNCDVGLILYGDQIEQLVQEVCPMKLFEYAAAGLPVVSTPLSVYQELDVPLWQVDTAESAVESVKEALAEKQDLEEKMRAFAAQNTWHQRYQEVLRVVEPLLTE